MILKNVISESIMSNICILFRVILRWYVFINMTVINFISLQVARITDQLQQKYSWSINLVQTQNKQISKIYSAKMDIVAKHRLTTYLQGILLRNV
jgi:hypothetical protein